MENVINTPTQEVAPLTKDELKTIANVLYNAPTQNLEAASKLIALLNHVQAVEQSLP